ncbi:MAG: cofactor-independent phosphoglycerate mutase [Ruminococcaceae bacterium]|nr:cofactor-independent phosphoglycerate mutase [Oscillospiraceae bacterium]MBQ3214859.1 cofactor-independent phosphoglycerate mutase [Oscillospiraceae bacterium]
MKYIVILGDGMAGEPLEALGGKTTLETAATPTMDTLASMGTMGLAKMVPDGMKPGSDVANLAVLGYDPKRNYSGRSPLEALSVGVAMEPTDVVLRCNLVTLSEDEPYAQKTIIDHSSGEISTADANVLMDAVRMAFNSDDFQFYTGTSYRHITIWKNGTVLDFSQPHDHLGQVIGQFLPENPAFRSMMERSFEILNNHPLNIQRAAEGKNKANSLWFWGAGTKPSLSNFKEKTGLKGAMISAVDLLKGIAVGAGMDVIHVEGATGSLHTNYAGKANAAVKTLLEDGNDFVYVHVEAPDEMGHQGITEHKVQAIEYLDSRIIAPIKEALDASGEDYRMLVLPDHPTPIRIRTHTSQPVPYILYDSRIQQRKSVRYTEAEAAATGTLIADGYTLMDEFLHI